MPENPNPYADPNMNPHMPPVGFNPNVPPFGQPGYADPANPYAQPMPGPYGMPGQPGFSPMGSGMSGASAVPMADAFPAEYFNMEGMASPQDIYANQGTPVGAPGSMQGSPMPGPQGQMPYGDPGAGFVDSTYQPSVQPMQGDAYGNAMQGGQFGYSESMPGGMPSQQTEPIAPQGAPYGTEVQPAYPYGAPIQMQPDAGQPYIEGQPAQWQQGAYGNDSRGAQSQSNTMQYDISEPPQQGMPEPQTQQVDYSAWQYGASGVSAAEGVDPSQQAAMHQMQGQPAPDGQQYAPDQSNEQMYYQQQYEGMEQPYSEQPYPYDNVIIEPIDPNAVTPGKATLALILGILSIIFVVVPPIGIILGIISMNIGKKYIRNGGQSGKAGVGRILGIVGFIVSIITFILLTVIISLALGATSASSLATDIAMFINSSPLGSIVSLPLSSYY